MKKKLLASAGAAVIGLTSIAGLGMASAATSSTSGSTSIVERIAQKFNLDKAEVQAVFDADRREHHAEMEAKAKERLAQAVTDGDLTQEQANKITAKREEMRTFMESLKDKTDEERKAAMDSKHDELKQWAEDNDIPERYLRIGHKIHRHGGPHGEGVEKELTTEDN